MSPGLIKARRSVCSGGSLVTSQVKQSVPQLQKIGSDMFYIESRHPALQHQEGPPGLSAVTSTSTPPPSHLSRSPADASETRNIRAPVWPSCTQNEITDSSRLQLIPDVSSCFCCWSDWNGRRSNPGIRKNTGSYMKRQLYQLCAAVFHASPPPVLITRPPWGRYGGPLFNELISFRSDSTDSSEEDG